MVLARRALTLLVFLLSSPSVAADNAEHDWRVAPYVWKEKSPVTLIVAGISAAFLVPILFLICVCWMICTNANLQEATGPEPTVAQPMVLPGLDQHLIEMVPLVSFQSDSTVGFDESGCVICLEEFVQGENIRALPCRHIFHPTCISKWLTSRSTKCPVCRRDYSV